MESVNALEDLLVPVRAHEDRTHRAGGRGPQRGVPGHPGAAGVDSAPRAASRACDVFALHQEPVPGTWQLLGAQVRNIGAGHTTPRAVRSICAQHAQRRFDLLHALWSGSPGLVAVTAARLLRIPSVVHVAGGELLALRDIGYGGRLTGAAGSGRRWYCAWPPR